MPMTPLPTPPSRSDPSNFAERGDAFLGALPVFATEANALETNVNAKELSATTAASNAALSATAAQNAANAAAGSVNATAWNAATNYSLDVRVISPTTRGMFRRIVAGTSATDPALDATNWAPFITAVINGGTGAATAAGARTNLGAAPVNAPIFTGTALELRAALDSLMVGYSTGRNRIMNGAALIAQNNAVTQGYGGPDGFGVFSIGTAGMSLGQGTMTINGKATVTTRLTATGATGVLTGTNYVSGIQQRFEGLDAFDLIGDKLSLSFMFCSNVTGTFGASLTDGNSTASIAVTFNATANVPVQVAIPLPVMPTSAVIPQSAAPTLALNIGALGTGTYQNPSTNAWVGGNYFVAAGATNWAAATNNFIEVTNLQLEKGGVVTPFERVSFDKELARARRRFYQFGYFRTYYGSGGMVVTEVILFPTSMRASPTVTPNASYANASNFIVNNVGTDGLFTNWTVSATGGATINGGVTCDARI